MMNSIKKRKCQTGFRSLKNTFIDEENLKELDHSAIIGKYPSFGKRNRGPFPFKNQVEKHTASSTSLNSSCRKNRFDLFTSNKISEESCKTAKNLSVEQSRLTQLTGFKTKRKTTPSLRTGNGCKKVYIASLEIPMSNTTSVKKIAQ